MRLRERLPDIAMEVFSVVFAVSLALFVNEWRQDRSDQALAARALEAVVEEVRSNRDGLVSTVEQHQESLDSLRVTIAAIDAGAIDSLGGSLQYDVALLKGTAWETARMTQVIIYMDYDVVAQLSGIYELQGLYMRLTDNFVDNMLSQDRPGDIAEARDMYLHHVGYLSNLSKLGQQLLDEYDGILQPE